MVRNSRPGSYRTSLNPIQKLQTLPHLEAAPTSSSPPAHNGDTSFLMDHWEDHSTQKRPRRCEAGAGTESLSHKLSIPSAFLKTSKTARESSYGGYHLQFLTSNHGHYKLVSGSFI